MPNGSYDLDAALVEWVQADRPPQPIIAVRGAPYGDEHGTDAKDLFFSSFGIGNDRSVSVVSTHLWSSLPGQRPLQPYLLYCLAGLVLSHCGDIHIHAESHDCVFDYGDEPTAIDRGIAMGQLCPDCERALNSALRHSHISNGQIAAARRLLQRAADRKCAFVVMPFRRELNSVHATVGDTLRGLGWSVVRGDRITQPRRITDAIVQAVLTADLVVADITGSNANVFYELGLAHASASDVIMLTQDRRIPFDVTTERAIRYTTTPRGLGRLKAALKDMIGPAVACGSAAEAS